LLCPPPEAVTMTVADPIAVEVVDVIVRLIPCPGAMVVAESFKVTPAGAPLAVSESRDEKPFCSDEVSLTTVEVPIFTLAELAGPSEKVGADVMVTLSGTEVASPPPLTVMVALAEPSTAVPLAVNLMKTAPAPGAAMEVGVRVAVTPLGSPVIAMATAELNPPALFVVRVKAPLVPCAKDRLVALADAESEGRLSAHCTVLLSVPAVAVMVAM